MASYTYTETSSATMHSGFPTPPEPTLGAPTSSSWTIYSITSANAYKHTRLPVRTLNDGYVRNVPLLQVPRIQSASPTTSQELIASNPLPGYLRVPRWIPMLPKLGTILGCSQRLLWPFPSI